MKKILLISALVTAILANPLEFKTLSADFTQSVASENAKISYNGNFIATQNAAFWHYETPSIKDVYFSMKQVVVIEPDLEQAIVTKVKEVPNLSAILANAKPNNKGIYEAILDDVVYQISVKNDLPSEINYVDKLGNQVKILLKNAVKNGAVDTEILTPKIPKNFDVVTQ